jgi:DNA polymerase-3 subunit delta
LICRTDSPAGKGETKQVAGRSTGDGAASWRKFEALLAKDGLSAIYVLFGRERYFIREAVERLRERVVPSPGLHELLLHSVVASEVSGAELADLARSEPIFGHDQLILVRDADKLKERDQKELQAYAEDPAPFTHMVLLAGDDFPKGALFTFLKKRYPGNCHGFQSLKRGACLEWVRKMAKEKGLERHLTAEILEGLVETGQASLGSLERQLATLALYVQDLEQNRIEDSLPFAMPEIALQQSYRFTDPLLTGDLADALQVLDRLVGQGIAPLVLLSRIAWEIRKIWQFKDQMERGQISDSFLRSVRIQPFKKAMYASGARQLSWNALGKVFFSLGETDRLLKSSRLTPQIHLEELCERIARLVAAGGRRKR